MDALLLFIFLQCTRKKTFTTKRQRKRMHFVPEQVTPCRHCKLTRGLKGAKLVKLQQPSSRARFTHGSTTANSLSLSFLLSEYPRHLYHTWFLLPTCICTRCYVQIPQRQIENLHDNDDNFLHLPFVSYFTRGFFPGGNGAGDFRSIFRGYFYVKFTLLG